MTSIRNRIFNGAKPDDQSSSFRKQSGRAEEMVAHEAARFIASEAGGESLITVIRAETRAHGDRMLVFISVFPEDKARAALAFLERHREAFSNHLKRHVRMRLPRIDFMLDNGENFGGPGGIRTLA